ncbi:hypothetical protein HVTV-2_gp60 [Haloarcula virus HVTV-2]|uniref:Uncharacterized protein n=1 Tax=Haloarcula vallismortis tailed virus 1 TaxID=1262528 RepID=L7TKC2_9CAUD|nr:hypothetical protein HVTV1_61 [Haloarcula vallismortis tailed virus 1]AGC34430.1 hypothetical protein HVTV1_61 [Haloarcula vallismortis tailed virus 1]UBF22867.1 hypothetical protein HVTV-2_gp60 [Haloarcula virus HVTV-2]
MSNEVPDPAEDFKDLDLDGLDMGFTDDDLEDVVDSVRGDLFQYSGVQCRVRKTEVVAREHDSITASQQKFWVAGVEVDWPDDVMTRAQQMFESDIWDTDAGWVEVRVGHERAVSREEAEDEAEWLAEQVVMLRNDPNAPV